MANTSDEREPRPARGPRGRITAALGSRTGLSAIVIAVLAGSIALGSFAGGAIHPTSGVAAASPTTAAPASAQAAVSAAPSIPSVQPSTAPSTTPSVSSVVPSTPPPTDPATPSVTPAAPPSPSVTPAPTPTPVTADGIPAKALQAGLDRLRAKLKIPGASVAIIWDDGRRWLGASGYRDVTTRDPMTTGTGFALASVSKTFTAAVVLLLVEEGKLKLDQRVAPLLPDYPMNPRITVRTLLDHTSGLPDFFLNPKIDAPLQSAKDAACTAGRSWKYVPARRPGPGRYWIYSNTNYLMLGELVTAVTGRPLATEIRERLLDPLGLETAWYQDVEEPKVKGTVAYRYVTKPGGGIKAVSVSSDGPVMPFRSVVTAAGGAGSMAMTASDAARWMQAFAGGKVLSPAMQRQMLADVARTAKLKPRLPYGLGIQALPIAGRYALGHSGRFLGFRNVVRYLPREGVSIAVLTNQGVQDPAQIAEALLKIVLPPLPKPSGSARP